MEITNNFFGIINKILLRKTRLNNHFINNTNKTFLIIIKLGLVICVRFDKFYFLY